MKRQDPFLHELDGEEELHRGMDMSLMNSPSYMANYLAQILSVAWRYEPFLKQWYHFDGSRWVESESSLTAINTMVLQVMQMKRILLKKAENVFQASFVTSVKKLLEADPRMQIRSKDLDTQFELLNTPDGTINLKTGLIEKSNSSMFISKSTSVSPLDDKDGELCPNYIRHIAFISEDNAELMRYFELFSGYCLTGHIFLQEFYTWCGFGANGKSMLYKIWQHIMGDYAHVASSGQFSVSGRLAHREQDLRLVGKRLVVSEEVSGWDLDKLKQFTDGGSIAAREMHGKTTAFIPQCKLLFLTNNPPRLTNLDYGVERRIKMITFNRRIDESMRNPKFLEECLIPEAPYILNRMVRHATEFLVTCKLEAPGIVKETSKEYFESENIVQQFIEDACRTDPNGRIFFGEFYDRFAVWCNKHGHDAPNKQKVGRQMSSKGYKKTKDYDRAYGGLAWLENAATNYIKPMDYHDKENWG